MFETGNKYNSRDQLLQLHALIGSPTKASSLRLMSSPLHAVTLPDMSRTRAAIPTSASFYSFCYPAIRSVAMNQQLRQTTINRSDPFVLLFTVGAFIYYDHKFEIVGINAISFDESVVQRTPNSSSVPAARWQQAAKELGSRTGTHRASLCLGETSPLPLSCIEPLLAHGRWAPCSVEHLIEDFGFTHFAWITPSEVCLQRPRRVRTRSQHP